MKPNKDKRFIVTQQNTGFTMSQYVLVDKQTGVNYLYVASGYSGGLTVLVDATGKPIVTPYVEE
ncbi:MAG: xylan 1,4-beta-xylosidase [Clostridia bacterium]|nr:xylan 1,4-beta-xylosidase [Clostridia bacterium]